MNPPCINITIATGTGALDNLRVKSAGEHTPLLYFFFAVVAVIGSVWIVLSDGFYFIDEPARFLYSRFVLQSLPVTVETWHRPIPQWLFALPAQFGHTVTMFFALALFLLLLYVAYMIAVLKGIKHSEWVVLLAGLQPVLFDISYTCMNEVPAALAVVLAYLYHLKGRHAASLAIAALGIMCRPEAYIFAIDLFLAYLRRREWKLLPLVLLGPLVWIASTTMISGNVMTFFSQWAAYSNVEKYMTGISLVYYVENLHTVFGVAQVLLFAAGVFVIARSGKSADAAIPYAFIAATIALNTLSGSELLHWTGSVGDLRYIAVAGPFVALVAASGLSAIIEWMRPSYARSHISAAVLALVVFNCVLTAHPHRWSYHDRISIGMAQTARAANPGLTLLNNNPAVQYEMDAAPSGGPLYAALTKESLAHLDNCLILWDPYTANSIFSPTGLSKEAMLGDPSITLLERFHYGAAEYLLFRKHASIVLTRTPIPSGINYSFNPSADSDRR